MTRIIVSGAAGKMGRRIVALALAEREFKLAGALEAKKHPEIGKDAGSLAGLEPAGVLISDNAEKMIAAGDCLIEFSGPEATISHLTVCLDLKKPVVIGTTGLNEEQRKIVTTAAASIPIVFSPNMSVGVNVLFKLVEEATARLGPGYEIEIVEAHHHAKKDAPSGTAKKIAEIVAKKRNQVLEKVGCWGRKGLVGARRPEEIGIHAVRAGDIVGEHTVIFCAPGERIELIHRAHSRDAFARGALAAAKFITGKKPGLYGMEDVLGI